MSASPGGSGSGEEVPVLLACRHGVDDHFFTALENQDNGLKQASLSVEAKSQLTLRPVVIIKRLNPQ